MPDAPISRSTPPVSKVHTPGHGSIEQVTAFLRISPKRMLKSLLYVAGKDVVMAVVRGDHDVNEVRLARALGVDEVFLATEADIKRATGADVGFAGPVGFKGRIIVDRAASRIGGGVTGANETDYHLVGVLLGRDFDGEIADVRKASQGDPCPKCNGGRLVAYRGIEAGHIFVLGTKYSAAMGASYLDEQQQKKPLVMGCYGIGVSRLVATAVEQHHDDDGIRWPMSLAPFQVHVCTLSKDAPLLDAAAKLYDELGRRGVEVLWDDRDERPGVKFKDADLLGMPLRVTFGGKTFAGGNVELKPRIEPDPKKSQLVPVAGAADVLAGLVRAGAGNAAS